MLEAAAADPDLHAFVDGCLDSQRRVDVLKRVARSPDDRSKVALWQDQNDSLRSAFAGVEDEPVPQSLDLAAPNRGSGLSFDCPSLGSIPRRDPAPRTNLLVSGLVAGVVLCAGVLLAVLVARGAAPPTEPVDLLTTNGLGANGDDPSPVGMGAARRGPRRGAVGAAEIAAGDLQGTRVSVAAFSPLPVPIAVLPDLSGQGLQLVEATRESTGALILRYGAASGDRVVVAISPDARRDMSTADVGTDHGDAVIWLSGGVAVAVAGTLPSADLRSVAATLRSQIAASPPARRMTR